MNNPNRMYYDVRDCDDVLLRRFRWKWLAVYFIKRINIYCGTIYKIRGGQEMPKYIVHPGLVKSISDGEVHYVSFYKLCELYGVSVYDCFNAGDKDRFTGRKIDPKYIHLYPQNKAEDYVLPKEPANGVN